MHDYSDWCASLLKCIMQASMPITLALLSHPAFQCEPPPQTASAAEWKAVMDMLEADANSKAAARIIVPFVASVLAPRPLPVLPPSSSGTPASCGEQPDTHTPSAFDPDAAQRSWRVVCEELLARMMEQGPQRNRQAITQLLVVVLKLGRSSNLPVLDSTVPRVPRAMLVVDNGFDDDVVFRLATHMVAYLSEMQTAAIVVLHVLATHFGRHTYLSNALSQLVRSMTTSLSSDVPVKSSVTLQALGSYVACFRITVGAVVLFLFHQVVRVGDTRPALLAGGDGTWNSATILMEPHTVSLCQVRVDIECALSGRAHVPSYRFWVGCTPALISNTTWYFLW